MVFLDSIVYGGIDSNTFPIFTPELVALILAFFVVFFIIAVIVYVYMGFAFMAIAKRARQSYPGLSWIPGVGPLIIAFKASKMHWWPWLLLIGCFIPFISFLFVITFLVFAVIWNWKMFEAIKRPGWWAILMLIPIVGFVMIGVAAWGKN